MPRPETTSVRIGNTDVHFHVDCKLCDALLHKILALEKELSEARAIRKNHVWGGKLVDSYSAAENVERSFRKVNLHLTPEDVNIPSTWYRQVDKLKESL